MVFSVIFKHHRLIIYSQKRFVQVATKETYEQNIILRIQLNENNYTLNTRNNQQLSHKHIIIMT
jgi:hypothetical protein